MSKEAMLEKMDLIDMDLVENASYQSGKKAHRYIPRFASVAACFCLIFVVTVSTAFAMNIGGIREWFANEWELLTGNSMTAEHTAVIDHLSQDIGISKTIDDVTITVDSATAGRDCFYLLLRVSGLNIVNRHDYNFRDVELKMKPDPVNEASALAGYGIEYLGTDEAQNSLFLLSYDYSGATYLDVMSSVIQIDLTLDSILQDGHTNHEKSVKDGVWYYAFTLDYQKAYETISLPNVDVKDEGLNKTYTLTDVELTNTGMHFRYPMNDMNLYHLPTTAIRAVMKNGAEIVPRSGVGSPTDDNSEMVMTYIWRVPLNLEEIDYIIIGDVKADHTNIYPNNLP